MKRMLFITKRHRLRAGYATGRMLLFFSRRGHADRSLGPGSSAIHARQAVIAADVHAMMNGLAAPARLVLVSLRFYAMLTFYLMLMLLQDA